MKALVIDAGNSCVTCAAWEGDHQRPALRAGRLVPPVLLEIQGTLSHPGNGSGNRDFVTGLDRIHQAAGRPPVILVSVVPQVEALVPSGVDLIVVDHDSRLPFELDVADPGQVGPDRLANMAAAAAAGLSRALVVDAGTATTFDLLIDGVFLGGMIAPGMAFAAQKIGETASRLAPVPFGPAPWEVGRDTGTAMAAGAWHSGTGGVRAVIGGLQDRYGPLPVILTGGLGVYFDDPGWYFDPHWTLRGAAILSNR